MKSIKFPGSNVVMAEDQPEYNSIHMKAIEGPEAEVIACYEFSDEELATIVKTKKLWYSRLRFCHVGVRNGQSVMIANPFQPFKMWPVTEAENQLIDQQPTP